MKIKGVLARMICWIFIFPLICSATAESREPAYTVFLATDSHVLSHDLLEPGAMMDLLIQRGDGKMLELSPEILDVFFQEAIDHKADAVILSGDLTFNGEARSLQEIAEKGQTLLDQGIPLYVIPGNHDIRYSPAYRYYSDHAEETETISHALFTEVCSNFGYSNSAVRCEASFSYIQDVPGGFRFLFLDANGDGFPGGLDAETLKWAQEQLDEAQKNELTVLVVTHQNVLSQSSLLRFGYVVYNDTEVRSLLESYDCVKAVFSGHSHLQHIATGDRFSDYATGSLCVAPLGYAVIELYSDENFTYHTELLPEFQEEAAERFKIRTEDQLRSALEDMDIPEREREQMIQWAVKRNFAYFGGNPIQADDDQVCWMLWETYASDTFWFQYLKSMD